MITNESGIRFFLNTDFAACYNLNIDAVWDAHEVANPIRQTVG